MEKNNNTAFSINGVDIPYSFRERVVNMCHGDRFLAGRLFYRAMAAKAKNPIRWLSAGICKGYAYSGCRDEDDNPGKVKEWVESVVLGYKEQEK